MFNFLGRMFGTEKAMSAVVDGVSNGLDKLIYTSEEQADDSRKAVTEARSMMIEWMKNSQGQNVARRFLAVVITLVWLLQYVSAQALSVAAVWADKPDQLLESAKIISESAVEMNGAMMLILAFYFAAPHMGKIVEGALSKFGGNNGP